MPTLKPKAPTPTRWPLVCGAAAGGSSRDFFVLGYSSEYDERFGPTNPPTYHSPTSRFTHILRYRDGEKRLVYRLPDRLLDLWWNGEGMAYGVGFPRAVYELDPAGCREIALRDHDGVFAGVWGTGEAHLFACGFKPFVLYRRAGTWSRLVLPPDTPEHLHDLAGPSERDVYVVGAEGAILHYDGSRVVRLESPTTRHLLSAALLNDQEVCVGGSGGLLLHGNRSGWRLVPTGTETDLYSLARFRNMVCFGDPAGVWGYDGRGAPILLVRRPAEWVSSVGDALLVRDGSEAWLFDGAGLTRLDTLL